MRSKTPAKRLPSARRTLAISWVVRLRVPLTIRNTRSATHRRASWAMFSAAGQPNVTASIAPNAIRADCSIGCSPSFVINDAQGYGCLSFTSSSGAAHGKAANFLAFSGALELPHGWVHNAVGGTMGSSRSPADPLFWLHHAMVDRLWSIWATAHH